MFNMLGKKYSVGSHRAMQVINKYHIVTPIDLLNFQDSEEKDIFQSWIFNNRTPTEDHYKVLSDTIRDVVHDEISGKKVA